MFTTMQMHAESRTIHRLLVAVAVIVFLALLLAPRASAGESRARGLTEPESLTAEQATAYPLKLAVAARSYSNALPGQQPVVRESPNRVFQATPLPTETLATLWLAMESQRAGEFAHADTMWSHLNFQPDEIVWREVARAMCSVMQGDVDLAEIRLAALSPMVADHALVHYVRAVVNMTLAERAGQWTDASGPRNVRLVRYQMSPVPHHPRSTYLLRASHHFRAAIRLAPELVEDAQLVSPQYAVATAVGMALDNEWTTVVPARVPTVREYLEAIGCAEFVARSHLGLAHLSLAAETFAEAEKHLDAAAGRGLNVQETWMQLGAAYERVGQSDGAARAYLRALGNGPAVATPVRRAIQSLGNLLR